MLLRHLHQSVSAVLSRQRSSTVFAIIKGRCEVPSSTNMDIVDRDIEKAEYEATRRFSQASKEDEERRLSAQATSAARRDSSDSVITESSSSSGSSISTVDDFRTRARRAPTQTSLSRTQTHPLEITRTETHRLQQTATVGGSVKTRTRESRRPLPEMGGGKPYPPQLPEREEYVVEFNGHDDPLHPQNWEFNKKLHISMILAFTCVCSTFSSSIFSTSTMNVAAHFHISREVAILTSSLYILGYAFGPILWAPFSELRGRRLPILVGMFGFSVFQLAVSSAKDTQTVMLGRFFCGFFGSCPLSVVAAVFSDMYDNKQRGAAITLFSLTVFLGPMLGPFIGGFINISYLGWRWTGWLVAIMSFTAFILNLIFLDESYPPVVLVQKAAELRRRTKNWGIHAKQDEVEVDFRELVTKNFSRPIRLLVTEPVVFLVSFYMSFIYGLLYLFLTAYPLVFEGVYHMNAGVAGLPFFGMVAGLSCSAAWIIFTVPQYNRKLDANGGRPVPEWRLPPVIVGGTLFAIGLFWFGWSSRPNVHWIVPTLSGLFTGFGLLAIFICLFNYLIDSFIAL